MANTIEGTEDLENVEIINTQTNEAGQFIITVRSTIEETTCHNCGKAATKLYEYADVRQVRLNEVFGLESYIRFYPKRYECSHCGQTTTQQLSDLEPHSHHTITYKNLLDLQLVNSTMSDVALKENLTLKEIQGIINHQIKSVVNWDLYDKMDLLGIDEISRKKGHKDFLTIVTARIDSKTTILGVLEDRKKETIKKFFQTIPKRLRKTIKAVCSLMYEGFVNAAKEVLKVKIVIDRLNKAKFDLQSLDSLRKSFITRLQKELSKEQYKELKNVFRLKFRGAKL